MQGCGTDSQDPLNLILLRQLPRYVLSEVREMVTFHEAVNLRLLIAFDSHGEDEKSLRQQKSMRKMFRRSSSIARDYLTVALFFHLWDNNWEQSIDDYFELELQHDDQNFSHSLDLCQSADLSTKRRQVIR